MHASETSGEAPRAEPALPHRHARRRQSARRHLRRLAAVADGSRGRHGGDTAGEGRTVTVAITAMTFHRPVFIGDEVTCYAEIAKVGRTSITVKVESWVRRGIGEEQIAVTEGIFTYVAVGDDRRPCPVPPEG